jgi:hypothetical protein
VTARDALAIAAIAAQALFTLSWLIGGLVQPGYSFDAQYISELAGHPARHAWIVQAGIAVWGLGFVALAGAVRFGVRRRPARTWIVALLVLIGVAGVCNAFFQLDCYTTISAMCRRAAHAGRLSWEHDAHQWVAFLTEPVPIVISLLVARMLWPHPLAWLPIAGAGLGVLAVAAGIVADTGDPAALPKHAGVAQRTGVLALNGGVVLLAIGLMAAPRLNTAARSSSASPASSSTPGAT